MPNVSEATLVSLFGATSTTDDVLSGLNLKAYGFSLPVFLPARCGNGAVAGGAWC
jgi:hypothetical protein